MSYSNMTSGNNVITASNPGIYKIYYKTLFSSSTEN